METRKTLSGDGLHQIIKKEIFDPSEDHRKNIENVQFSIGDTLMSGFAMFSLKCPSLLNFEERSLSENEGENIKTLYHIDDIPSDCQLRSILDPVDPEAIKPAFKRIFSEVQRGKALEDHLWTVNGTYLVSIDASGFFSSTTIHCTHCLKKKSKKEEETIYHHQLLGMAITHPTQKVVIPFVPEPILNEDGYKKNDCERNAAKRLLERFRREHPHLRVTILGDALYSNAPFISELQRHEMGYILSVKEGDHPYLFSYVNALKDIPEFERKNYPKFETYEFQEEGGGKRVKKIVRHHFQFVNQVPLNEGNEDLKVNFLDYREITEYRDKNGKLLREEEQHFSWITAITLRDTNVYRISKGGRCRWQIENGVFNTLKNQGYYLEHNFGHGKENLSTNLMLLMMLAFFVDQVQQLSCRVYQVALKVMRAKYILWEKIRSVIDHTLLHSWEELLLHVIRLRAPLYNSA